MERHPSWTLTYDGYEPAQEGLRETLCALGNGYFVTRAAAPDSVADGIHYPGTYLAGGYNRLITEIAGREIENEDLVNLPNWLPLVLRIADGDWLRPDGVQMTSGTASWRVAPAKTRPTTANSTNASLRR